MFDYKAEVERMQREGYTTEQIDARLDEIFHKNNDLLWNALKTPDNLPVVPMTPKSFVR